MPWKCRGRRCSSGCCASPACPPAPDGGPAPVALLAGTAVPVARVFASAPAQVTGLALAFAAFAPGLIGYGLVACLSRVLLADGRRVAQLALVAGVPDVLDAGVWRAHVMAETTASSSVAAPSRSSRCGRKRLVG